MDMKMRQKLETEMVRYRSELLQLNANIELQRNKNYEYWSELLRTRDSVKNALETTRSQLEGRQKFTGGIGSMATGIRFVENDNPRIAYPCDLSADELAGFDDWTRDHFKHFGCVPSSFVFERDNVQYELTYTDIFALHKERSPQHNGEI